MNVWDMCGISWNGFNLFGPKDSIDEVKRLINRDGMIKPLQDRIASLEIQLQAIKERLGQ